MAQTSALGCVRTLAHRKEWIFELLKRLLVRHPLAQICQLIDDGQAKLDERK